MKLELIFSILFRTDYGLRTDGGVEVITMLAQLLVVAIVERKVIILLLLLRPQLFKQKSNKETQNEIQFDHGWILQKSKTSWG